VKTAPKEVKGTDVIRFASFGQAQVEETGGQWEVSSNEVVFVVFFQVLLLFICVTFVCPYIDSDWAS
jgi:hypothetical protein